MERGVLYRCDELADWCGGWSDHPPPSGLRPSLRRPPWLWCVCASSLAATHSLPGSSVPVPTSRPAWVLMRLPRHPPLYLRHAHATCTTKKELKRPAQAGSCLFVSFLSQGNRKQMPHWPCHNFCFVLFCFCEATLELHGLWKLLAGLLTCSVRWLVACVRFALYSVVLCLHALAISSCGSSALLDLAQFLSINFRLSFGSTVLSLTSCLKIGLFFNSSGSAKTVTRQ